MTEELWSRRTFLKTAAIGAAFAAAPFARSQGANDDVRLAVVGLGNKGTQHAGEFKKIPGVRVVALCDPDPSHTKAAIDKHFKEAGDKPKTYTDVRKLLEDKDIDAVLIATPNHWHAPITVWACQAGKDVYVEKPVSHTIWEGQQMVAAAKKYNRIVQCGMQSRSDSGMQAVREYVKAGELGEIELMRAIYYNQRKPIGKVSGPQTPPEGVDFDLWLGPAEGPLEREKLHYDWHWQWKYGNGELGNNGVHMLDLATFVLDIKELPSRVISMGNRFAFDDDGQTPNTHITYYDAKPVPLMCEIRNLPRWVGDPSSDHVSGVRTGLQVIGSEGYYIGYNNGGWVYDKKGEKVKQIPGDGGGAHHKNFIDAVRSRKAENLAAPIEVGHLSAGICHMGNISYRLGEAAKGDDIREAIGDNDVLHTAVDGLTEHLLLNHINVIEEPRLLGPWLTMDPKTQKFTGEHAEKANEFLKGTYRAGFEIPEEV